MRNSGKTIRKKAVKNWILFSLTVSAMLLTIGRSDRWGMIKAMEISGIYAATGNAGIDNIEESDNESIMDENAGKGASDTLSEQPEDTEAVLTDMNSEGQSDISEQTAIAVNPDNETSEKEEPEFGMLSGRDIDPDKPMIALTFDDGPYPPVTEELIEFLLKNDARATFFVVGYNADKYTSTIQEAYEKGFEIANHTESHASLVGLTKEELHDEVDAINELLNSFGIKGSLYLRPPYGSHDETMEANLSVPMITWSVDSQDWLSRDADSIEKRIIGQCEDGDIILMHDIYQSTLDAVKTIVPKLIEEGFQLVTVSEMFQAKGIETKAGVCYNSAK